MIVGFNQEIVRYYLPFDSLANCRDITLQVTDDCCLNCSYCYQHNKGHNFMTKETAKQIIDFLFKLYDDNDEKAIINHHTKGITLNLIGGEPLMNIDVIEYICNYFFDTCIQLRHEWLCNSKILIDTNGVLYFLPQVQQLIEKFKGLIQVSITVDGPQSLHDSCRKNYQNEGSFDLAFSAWKDWNSRPYAGKANTKITLVPENLIYFNDICDFFIKNNCQNVVGGPAYEPDWQPEHATIYYYGLKKLADTILEHPEIEVSWFDELCGRPKLSTETGNWCGGLGMMLAFNPDGVAYPCLRYMESSLGKDIPPVIIGSAQNGIYQTEKEKSILKEMTSVTRRSQSTDECFNCHIASGCSWCSAYCYQVAGGKFNKRETHICWMHRARVLANVYYWNKYYQKNQINKRFNLYLDRNIASKIISNEEYDMLLQLSGVM